MLVLNFIFGGPEVHPILLPLSGAIMLLSPYANFIHAGMFLVLGYLVVNALSGMVYLYMRRRADHPTATVIRTLTKVSGVAVLLAVAASILNVNPAAALTIGSFWGLVAGLAIQTLLLNALAGAFLQITRPFTYEDTLTISGHTGIVKEIKAMHLLLQAEDGTKDILIPNATVLTQIILKKRPPMKSVPIETAITLEPPPSSVKVGTSVVFAGKLVESESGKPIADTSVRLLDSDVGRDDLLVTERTDGEGRFTLRWTARKTDPRDRVAEIYAKFEGNDKYQPSRTETTLIDLKT